MGNNTIVLSIEGMTCGGCVRIVNKTLASFDDIDTVETDLKSCTSTIAYNVERLNLLPILTSLDELGMEAFLISSPSSSSTSSFSMQKHDCNDVDDRDGASMLQ